MNKIIATPDRRIVKDDAKRCVTVYRGHRTKTFTFEEIATDPEGSKRRMSKFMGIDDPAELEAKKLKKEARVYAIKKNGRKAAKYGAIGLFLLLTSEVWVPIYICYKISDAIEYVRNGR